MQRNYLPVQSYRSMVPKKCHKNEKGCLKTIIKQKKVPESSGKLEGVPKKYCMMVKVTENPFKTEICGLKNGKLEKVAEGLA